MKLATIGDGSRDGRLVVVSHDLSRYANADKIATTMQEALDNWHIAAPRLEILSQDVENKSIKTAEFSNKDALSPLPRSYQWLDGSAYVNHVELVRKARGAEMPENFWHDPLMYQGSSDCFLAPTANIVVKDIGWGVDFEAEIAIITDDVPLGVSIEDATKHIKLITLANDISLRNLIPDELKKGFGFLQSKPSSSFAPIAVTIDELKPYLNEDKLNLPINIKYNNQLFGYPNAGNDMTFSFSQLISHAAKTRHLSAGTIIGSGTISNKFNNEPSRTVKEGGVGYSCIAEVRMIEKIFHGRSTTDFMQYGDNVKIEAFGNDGLSIFGAIEQTVTE